MTKAESKRVRDAEYRRKRRSTAAGAAENRAQAAAGMARLRAIGREVDIPPVVNESRHDSCKQDLLLFYDTYFPHLTSMESAPYHIEILQELQRCILYGTSKAIAAPRGGGKDTLFTIAVLWAILYGHSLWLVYVGATGKSAVSKLDNIKFQLEENPLLFEDFPAVCAPIRALERAPQRARAQRILDSDGEAHFSHIKWSSEEIVFPTVEGSPSSGSIITAIGLDSAIRGLVKGEKRPDFVCINDGETDEAARSEIQRTNLVRKIDQGISGLAGPGCKIAKFFLCTIVCKGCISEMYTDPTQKPAWNGSRYSGLVKFPEREDLWIKYMDMRREGQMSGSDPYGRAAHKYYKKHRKIMDKGAKPAWDERYIKSDLDDGEPAELSALQHLYNVRTDNGEHAFFSEIQNDPLPENDNALGLTAELVASRCGGYAPGIVPENAVGLTRGIDVGARELHSTIKAHLSNGDSFIVDYTRIPVEAPSGDLRNPTGSSRKALEEAVLSALRLARDEVESYPLKDSSGEERNISLTLVDAGFLDKVIYTFTNESGPKYRPAKGYSNMQGQKRYSPPQDKSKRKRPLYQCYASKLNTGQILYHVNADHWKLHTQMRFLQDPETNGACALWGMDPGKHRNFGKHIVAELFDPVTGKWEKQSKHNHFLDSTALADCAAGMLGVRIESLAAKPVYRDPDGTEKQPVKEKGTDGIRLKAPAQSRGGARTTRRRQRAW